MLFTRGVGNALEYVIYTVADVQLAMNVIPCIGDFCSLVSEKSVAYDKVAKGLFMLVDPQAKKRINISYVNRRHIIKMRAMMNAKNKDNPMEII